MALKATVFKAEVQVSDMERGHYQTYNLTLARHPSETDERLMVRLLAFTLNADAALCFTKGLSTDDEPELWRKSLSDEIESWIELGQLDEKRLRRACGLAKQVIVYLYAEKSANVWWSQQQDMVRRFSNLRIAMLTVVGDTRLESLAQRNMSLHATVQDNQVWLSDDQRTVTIDVQEWFP
ncbi:MAG: YaeQ family protein [Candidatus Thiodiazotropha endolucinida]|nr:YaeQ family protein [Candidatus Thiodiazotropha taylori]MCG8097380.1 YaeQ family protein [Candidatus Thiodiazotropha endolucinida]MCG8062387.1 YaeQ family protein [Candidatus Thiodiazotropha taylori]MCG8063088.1 YaeQ family protein [Candidatus Thiodiazotropha taylori]MCW4329167.1 YaeQ family protein [Candidatus Thiodiazotropha endolucinida]